MLGLWGAFEATIDDKGRFALPAKLRAVTDELDRRLLDGELALCKGHEDCLWLLPKAVWVERRKSLRPLNFFGSEQARRYIREIGLMTFAVTPDGSGRIMIPSHLCAEAGLEKDVLVLGVGELVEIWAPAVFKKYRETYPDKVETIGERLLTKHDGEGS